MCASGKQLKKRMCTQKIQINATIQNDKNNNFIYRKVTKASMSILGSKRSNVHVLSYFIKLFGDEKYFIFLDQNTFSAQEIYLYGKANFVRAWNSTIDIVNKYLVKQKENFMIFALKVKIL